MTYTIDKIKREFHLTKTLSFTENKGSYTQTFTEQFADYGGFCDIYINYIDEEINQKQVDTFNYFLQNFKQHLPKVEHYISSGLKSFEKEISSPISFDVISVPQNNKKYDLVLVLSKKIKFFFFEKDITIRVEFQNNFIKNISRIKASESAEDIS